MSRALCPVDQRNSGAVDPGNGLSGERGDLAQQFEYAAGAGHHSCQTRSPARKSTSSASRWAVDNSVWLWWFATRLGVEVGHRLHNFR